MADQFQPASKCDGKRDQPLGLLDELADLGECTIAAKTTAIPTLDVIDPTNLYLSWSVTLTTDKPRSDIDDVFIFVMDDMALEVREIAAAPAPVLDIVPPPAPVEEAAKANPAAAQANDGKQNKSAENVRVPAERLDELMDRVGELVIAQSRLSQLANTSVDIQLRSVSEDVERLSGELRDTMMVLRMVPIAQLFGRFRRLIHDLARETGKQIELVTEGESTEVDKAVIERLADPSSTWFATPATTA